MASSESVPLPGTAHTAATSERSSEDPTGELTVTTELPPAAHDGSRSRRRSRRATEKADETTPGRADDAEEDADAKRGPLFAPARRPGRRVIRVVRHVQLWSVFKVALLAGLVFYAIFLIAVGVGWSVANATGQVHHIEQFMRQIGFDNWAFNGPQLFRASALIGAILLAAGSILITLFAAIVNLIAEATGGLRFTVIEVDESDDEDDDTDEGA